MLVKQIIQTSLFRRPKHPTIPRFHQALGHNIDTYKCGRNNKSLVKVDRYYPSSKTRHICGYKKTDLTLTDREWICPICNTVHNRDLNAPINILNEGLGIKSLSLGIGDYADRAAQQSSTMVSDVIFKYLDEAVLRSEATKSLA